MNGEVIIASAANPAPRGAVDRRYEFRIAEVDLARSPEWKQQPAQRPPLPIEAAVQKAQQAIRSVPTEPLFAWGTPEKIVLLHAPLRELGRQVWLYVVHFVAFPPSGMGTSGGWPRYEIVVLMSGKVYLPVPVRTG